MTPARRVATIRRTAGLVALTLMGAIALLRAAPPTVSDAQPNSGSTAGGLKVLISGTGFSTATAVRFGNTPAAAFEIQSDIRILATTPTHPEGTVGVTVVNPDGSWTLANGYTFLRVPFSGDDAFTTSVNTTLEVSGVGVLTNDNSQDGGPMVVSLETNVTSGTLTLQPDGSFTYVPNTGFVGTDVFTYRATNNFGAGNLATVTITVEPARVPRGLYVSSLIGNRVTLRWIGATLAGVTDHVVEGGVGPGQVLGTLNTGSAFPIAEFVAPTGVFFFRVRAIAGGVLTGPSNEIQVFVNVPVAPSAPDSVLALVNDSSLALAWRNTFAGGAPGSLVLDVSGSIATSIPLGLANSFSFAGVPAGTYTLSLRALNAAGSSAPSNAVTVTFPGPCSGPPLTPANFLAYRTGNTVAVVWDPAATGPAPTNFIVDVTGSLVGSFPTAARMLSGTVAPGTYSFAVTAQNVCGVSAPTAVQTMTVP